MKLISRTEEIILVTVYKLGKKAYGVAISDHIAQKTGLNWKFGSIYSPLGRLVENGYLRAIEGEPTPERGGRRKIYYEPTESGIKALKEIQKVNSAVWIDMPGFETEK